MKLLLTAGKQSPSENTNAFFFFFNGCSHPCWRQMLAEAALPCFFLSFHAHTPTDQCVSRVLPLGTVLPIAINYRRSLESAYLYIFQRFQLKL